MAIIYSFRFFDQLVQEGHLYVLETPRFRLRNKEQTITRCARSSGAQVRFSW